MQRINLANLSPLLFCLLICLTISLVSSTEVEFGYNGADGPQNWFRLSSEFGLCRAGKQQSPIDIPDSEFKHISKYPPIPYWKDAYDVEIHNNGNTVEVGPKESENKQELPVQVYADGSKWQLQQFHFHTPSEHRVNGISKNVEMHMVFKNEKKEILVVSVFFVISEKRSEFLAIVLDKIPKEKGYKNEIKKVPFTSLLSDLKNLKEVYNYYGSLTTPPCTEGVRWYINNPIQELSLSQFNALHNVIGDNNRFIQERFQEYGKNATRNNDGNREYNGENKKYNKGYKGKDNKVYKGKDNKGYKGNGNDDYDNDGYKGKDNKGYKGKDNKGYGGNDNKGYGGNDNKGYGGNDNKGYEGNDNKGYEGNDNKGYGGNDNKGYGWNNNKGYGGNNNKGYEGNDNKGYGGNDNKGYGGNDNKGYGGNGNDGYDNKGYGRKDNKGYKGNGNNGYGNNGYGNNGYDNKGSNEDDKKSYSGEGYHY